MALKPTNSKKTPITEVEFRQKLKTKDGNFQNRIFNFAITSDLLQETLGLAEDGNIHFNFDLDFADSEFQKIDVGSDMPYNYDAPKVRFSGKVNFEGARFSGEADFSEATFSGEANFSEATFSDIAIFWQATFSKEVNFIATTFSKEANFYNATFSDRAYFWQAKFSGKADFEGARFSGEVSFLGARFSGKADFSEARFSREANFSSAKFSNRTYFFMAAFSEKADFTVATFSGKVEFIGTTFSRKVGFVKARFSDIADFGYVVFSQKVDFTYTILLNKVRFRRATFSQDHHTYFCNLNLKQKDNPDKRNEKETYTVPSLQFRDIIFPKLVLFSNCNLSQTTFESCTIADIKFRSCEFAKTGVFIFKRNAFENRTGQKGFWKNFWFALRLEGRLLKKAFSKNQDSSLTKKRGEILTLVFDFCPVFFVVVFRYFFLVFLSLFLISPLFLVKLESWFLEKAFFKSRPSNLRANQKAFFLFKSLFKKGD